MPRRQRRVLLLDGAMGTTLETLGYDVSGPMWGSELVHSDPQAIRRVHEGYTQAGADIIETATYQMSLGPLLRNHVRAEAEGIMRQAVNLAYDTSMAPRSDGHDSFSTSTTFKERDDRIVHPAVALSLGPLGATLSPSQEYAGIYPPPFGPSLDPDRGGSVSKSPSKPTNGFPSSPSGQAEQQAAEDALTTWHLDRLRIYASDEATWRKIEWLAFETVSLLTEIRAIRRAVGRLCIELERRWSGSSGPGETVTGGSGGGLRPPWWKKRFWITSVYPDGRHPQHTPDGAGHVSVDQVLQALLDEEIPDQTPVPDGIGINCTHPQYLLDLTADFSRAMSEKIKEQDPDPAASQAGPVFVLYPDGGAVYDTTSKTWTQRSTGATDWARSLAAVVKHLDEAEWCDGNGKTNKVWEGVIVGGCCKAGFDEIGQLRRELYVDTDS